MSKDKLQWLKAAFTFQYGSTLIQWQMIRRRTFLSLHFQYGSTLIGNTSGGSTIIANFTFQYGSTLMLSKRILSAPNASFTFQYGSTLIGVGNKLTKDDLTLHSNMVLL